MRLNYFVEYGIYQLIPNCGSREPIGNCEVELAESYLEPKITAVQAFLQHCSLALPQSESTTQATHVLRFLGANLGRA